MRDLLNNIKATQAFPPIAAITDNTPMVSTIVDTQNFDALVLLLNTGTLTDADATFALLMEEGDASNLSDAATVAAGDLLGTIAGASFTFADDNKMLKIGYRGSKRYVRATVTPTANTGNFFMTGTWLQGAARTLPLSTQKN